MVYLCPEGLVLCIWRHFSDSIFSRPSHSFIFYQFSPFLLHPQLWEGIPSWESARNAHLSSHGGKDQKTFLKIFLTFLIQHRYCLYCSALISTSHHVLFSLIFSFCSWIQSQTAYRFAKYLKQINSSLEIWALCFLLLIFLCVIWQPSLVQTWSCGRKGRIQVKNFKGDGLLPYCRKCHPPWIFWRNHLI